MSEVTQASAEIVKRLEPKKPPPLDIWLLFEYSSEDIAWHLSQYWSEQKAQKRAIELQRYGTHVRIIHVRDGAPVDPNAKLREMLEWMMHACPDFERGGDALLRVRQKIRELIGDDDGR